MHTLKFSCIGNTSVCIFIALSFSFERPWYIFFFCIPLVIAHSVFVSIDMAALSINEHEGDGDQDTLGPLPPHQQGISWMSGPPSYGYVQMPPYPTAPPAMVDAQTPGYAQSFYSAHSGSQSPHSASGSSKRSGGGGGGSNRGDGDNRSSGGSSSEKSGSSSKGKEREARSVEGSAHPPSVTMPGVPMPGVPVPGTPGLAMMPRPLDQVPDNMSASRNSFRMAMGNPCEFFVDVM